MSPTIKREASYIAYLSLIAPVYLWMPAFSQKDIDNLKEIGKLIALKYPIYISVAKDPPPIDGNTGVFAMDSSYYFSDEVLKRLYVGYYIDVHNDYTDRTIARH